MTPCNSNNVNITINTMADCTFHAVLRDIKRHDSFDTRQLFLSGGSEVPIGRASKSVAKKELVASPYNAYIDSPVMSRDHAVLSVRGGETNAPQFFITDNGSMHGTMLNGRSLVPGHLERLTHGDLLQFGVDVNRNEDFFVARQYAFEVHFQRRFSSGFAVPDAESDEESANVTEQQGSESNPLHIDDSDAGSNPYMAAESECNVTREAGACESLADTESAAEESDQDAMVAELAPTWVNDRYSVTRAESASANSSPQIHEFSDPEMSDFGSDCGSDAESDDASSSAPYTSTDAIFETSSTKAEAPLERSPIVKSQNPFTLDSDMDEYTCTYHTLPSIASQPAPPSPTRPLMLATTPYSAIDIDPFVSHDWPDVAHAGLYVTHGGPYLNPDLTPAEPATYPVEFTLGTTSAASRPAQELQTPLIMPALDTVIPASHPGRRTRVSIEEIVEHQSPSPSPESAPTLKRKATVLEEEEPTPMPMPERAAPEPSSPQAAGVMAATRAENEAACSSLLVAPRPKKQPSSLLAKVGRTATYFGAGTAGALAAVTALAFLPETFFT